MDRTPSRHGRLLVILGLTLLVATAGGCTQALLTALYLIKGTDLDAECNSLNKKRVAVVCRCQAGLQYQDSRVAAELARTVAKCLTANGSKIKTVDQRKVEKWTDENTWDEYVEVGKAVDAEMVLGIDLDHFQIYQGQTLYQGRANTSIKVYDCKTGDVAFEKTLPPTIYPPNSCVHTSEKAESQFRSEFIQVLAECVGRHFYSHDAYADMTRDVDAGL